MHHRPSASKFCWLWNDLRNLLSSGNTSEHMHGSNMNSFIPAWSWNGGQVITSLAELLSHQNSESYFLSLKSTCLPRLLKTWYLTKVRMITPNLNNWIPKHSFLGGGGGGTQGWRLLLITNTKSQLSFPQFPPTLKDCMKVQISD